MSLQQLLDIQVTTASRIPEEIADVPAAVFVITQEDIRRSGATSIPEALRLAPGVQVARISAGTWAIGIRGFADRLARSLLVLTDGRAVYSPLFAGTYWETKDLTELHGGSVTVESEGLNTGTTFRVRLPRMVASAPAMSPSTAGAETSDLQHLDGIDVLIVDDNPDALDIVTIALSTQARPCARPRRARKRSSTATDGSPRL